MVFGIEINALYQTNTMILSVPNLASRCQFLLKSIRYKCVNRPFNICLVIFRVNLDGFINKCSLFYVVFFSVFDIINCVCNDVAICNVVYDVETVNVTASKNRV